MPMGSDYIPISEAARRSGLHPNTIQRLLRAGKIHGYKENHYRWLVSVRSLERYTNPMTGFLLDRPGPKIFLTRRDEQDDEREGS